MNKEYTYVDGKVIIRDEKGNQVLGEYYDNLDKVLIKENIIETMEGRISELEMKSKLYKKNNLKHYIPIILPVTTLIGTIGFPVMIYFLTGSNPFMTSVDTIYGVINEGVLYSTISFPISILIGGSVECCMYLQHRDSVKKEKGVNSELEYLQKQIVKERQVLEELKKEKKRDKEVKEFRVVEVNDKDQLNVLKGYLSLYFDLGYNLEKYFRYLQLGKLDEKLSESYTEIGIEVAKDYLEEKGPTLKKRKNK